MEWILLILIIAGFVCGYFCKKKGEHTEKLPALPFIIALLTVIVIAIMIYPDFSGNDTLSTGYYAYYVNGQRVSSGFITILESVFFFLLAVLAFGFLAVIYIKVPAAIVRFISTSKTSNIIVYVVVACFFIALIIGTGIRERKAALLAQKELIESRESRGEKLFHEGLARVSKNDKWGFIDKTGKQVIAYKYEGVKDFSEGLAQVSKNDKWGFIDKTGKEVIHLKYDYAVGFSEGLALVALNGKCGFIDKTGKEVIPLKYDEVDIFREGLALVVLNGKWGFIDKTGNEVIPLKYDEVDIFKEGIAKVQLNGKLGYIDKTGKEVIPLKDEDVELPHKVIPFQIPEVVIPLEDDDANDFINGKDEATLNGKSFHIDKTEKKLTVSIDTDGEGVSVSQVDIADVVVEQIESRDKVFDFVEQMPAFPGGTGALMRFLSDNMQYPAEAIENGIQGKVMCRFVINNDGSIRDAQIIRSVDPSLDKEAIRLINSMPKWEPGKHNGKEVAAFFTVPVFFRLPNETK